MSQLAEHLAEQRVDEPVSAAWERLQPVFDGIAEKAAQRERARALDHDAVETLVAAGYTSLRVPTEYGGAGLSLSEFYPFVVELGAADSNLVQALRAHQLHVEMVLANPDQEYRDRWFRRIAAGEVVGNAVTEVNGVLGEHTTTVTVQPDGSWLLNGRKYYSTGSLYADWILVTAEVDGSVRGLAVRADAPGVRQVDDWDGFGQRLSASGTTVFENVVVDPAEVSRPGEGLSDHDAPNSLQALAQTVHLAALAGLVTGAEREFVRYVRQRRRTFSHAAAQVPSRDPQVLQVLGEVSAAAYGARAVFESLIRQFERVQAREITGEVTAAELAALDVATYQAQQVISQQSLWAINHAFSVGGATAVTEPLGLDRYWRNARVLAQHNPVIYRNRIIGDFLVNGTAPGPQYGVGNIS
ncbi:acyl-CoA dehydrogenase family protein [Micrococcoides hystricis]|uniref:Dibenzothiophene monooxygenase n=1 Tax=Micrococcoides hystricis TaxID=1572761 RepID=A0ABV6PCC9_9MICC